MVTPEGKTSFLSVSIECQKKVAGRVYTQHADAIIYGKSIGELERTLVKGLLVVVSGEISISNSKGGDGKDYHNLRIVGQIQVLDGAPAPKQQQAAAPPRTEAPRAAATNDEKPNPDDIPF